MKKRAAMYPLLYIENFLWLMLLGWTGKGTGRGVGGGTPFVGGMG